MPFWMVLLLLAALLPKARDVVVQGVVTDSSGKPLAGATVNAMPSDVAVTGADGRFTIKNPDEIVRFTADGYVPATRTRVTLQANPVVVLEAAARKPRVLPVCNGRVVTQPSAGWLKVPTPEGIPRQFGADDDSVSEGWSYGKASLLHGSGPMWSYGLPPPTVLARLTALDERDVRLPIAPIADVPGIHLLVDVRGAYPDGRRYRFVGKVGETFEYDGASIEGAAIFDRMLDAMCYVERKPH